MIRSRLGGVPPLRQNVLRATGLFSNADGVFIHKFPILQFGRVFLCGPAHAERLHRRETV